MIAEKLLYMMLIVFGDWTAYNKDQKLENKFIREKIVGLNISCRQNICDSYIKKNHLYSLFDIVVWRNPKLKHCVSKVNAKISF